MNRIIIATDHSQAARNAAEYGAQMALALKADVLLFHVFNPPVVIGEVPVLLDLDSLQIAVKKQMKELQLHLLEKTNNEIRIDTVESMGTFFYQLETVCSDTSPYAVIMGSQGTSASDRFFFGSETIYAMRNLRWPLITVPIGTQFSTLRKIGLASNLEEEIDDELLSTIKRLVTYFEAELHIINIGDSNKYKPSDLKAVASLKKDFFPLNLVFHFISADKPDEGLIDFAEENNMDLLITVPKHRNFLESFIDRKVSNKLILRSQIPILSLPH